MNIKPIKNIVAGAAMLAAMLGSAFHAGAVTKEEFEQARTIAATAYIRYTDPSSGYLDGKSPKTMSELEALVKPHDKDVQLLADFKSKPTATDYATWTKADLKAYWSNTFFQGSGLSTEAASGRKAKIQAGIGAMTVADPAPAQEEQTAPAQDTAGSNEAQSQYPEELTSPQETTLTEEIADTVTTEESEPAQDDSAGSKTWLYIVILVILVIIVIVLVVFAARMMKKPSQQEEPAEEPQDEAPRSRDSEPVSSRLAEIERENRRLREELASARRTQAEHYAPKPEPKPEPKPAAPAGTQRIIYLGRANSDKVFVRADREFTPEKSIFKLVTDNGLTGTYYVVPQPKAVEWIAVDPHRALDNGAEVATWVTAAGMTAVVTDTAGTAIFEDGCWRVLRPAAVHFE